MLFIRENNYWSSDINLKYVIIKFNLVKLAVNKLLFLYCVQLQEGKNMCEYERVWKINYIYCKRYCALLMVARAEILDGIK